MSEQEKHDKESMVCLTTKPSKKKFRNNWRFFMASTKPRPKKQKKKMQLLIQILFRLRLLLRQNGIKYLKNLFWRNANRFEVVLIQ